MTRARKGFSIVELLVVLAIITILAALIMPGVQRARESANQVVCANNLRQIGLAFQQFEQTHKILPPNRLPCGPTWAFLILPFLEQDNLYKQWDPEGTYYDQSPLARETSVAGYFCPSRRSVDTPPHLSVAGDQAITTDGILDTQVRGALGDYAYNLGTAHGEELDDSFLRPQVIQPRGLLVKAISPSTDNLVQVANLHGLDRIKAKAILDVRQLLLKDVENSNNLGGYVVSQSPSPGTMVKKNSTVNLQFVYKVPDVRDKRFGKAQSAITESGLVMKSLGGDEEYGVVINQSPAPNSPVKMGTLVEVDFAIRVPYLKGDYYEARGAVKDVGLQLNSFASDYKPDCFCFQWRNPSEYPSEWQTPLAKVKTPRGVLTKLGLLKKYVSISRSEDSDKQYDQAVIQAIQLPTNVKLFKKKQYVKGKMEDVSVITDGFILDPPLLKLGRDIAVDNTLRVEDPKSQAYYFENYLDRFLVLAKIAGRTEFVNEDFVMETLLVPAGGIQSQNPLPRTIVPRGTIVTAQFPPQQKEDVPPGPGGGGGGVGGGGWLDNLRHGGSLSRHLTSGTGHHRWKNIQVHKVNSNSGRLNPIKTSIEDCSSAGLTAFPSFPYDCFHYKAVEITDGLSNTFLVGEKHVPFDKFGQGGWDCALYNGSTFACSGRGVGQNLDLAGSIRDPGWKFGSYHPGICQFLFADGSVRVLTVGTDPVILGRLAHHSDGNPIPPLE